MASFLDYYSSLSEQINKISIDQASIFKNHKDEQKYFTTKFQTMLNVLTQKIDSRKTNHIEYQSPQICSVTFIYDSIYLGFDILSKIKFNKDTYQISLTNTIMRNYLPLRVKHKEMRLQINRYLIKMNAILKYGSMSMNPLNGQIVFSMNSFLSMYQFQALIYEPMKLVQLIQEELLKSKHYIRIHIYKILYLMNELTQLFPLDCGLSAYQVKSVNTFSKATMALIDKMLPFLHLQFPFMYNDHTYSGVKNVSPDLVKKMNEMIRMLKYNSKLIHEDISKVIQHMTGQKTQIKNNNQLTFTDDEKKDLMNILLPPFVRHQSGEPPYVYSEIQISVGCNPNWDIIDQGGFGMIRKATVQFVYKKDIEKYHPRMNTPFKRVLVKKDDFQVINSAKSKLNHEKQILSQMKHSISPFIAKFFYTQQHKYANSLFIEYCPQKSFASYRQKNYHFMELNTKLIFMKYIAQAIKFLKDHKICHLDLKPSNILFGNGHIKLIDFGQAYHPEVCQKNFRPGTSLPYAPPESFSQDIINFSDRLDIFSFGILMHQILYDTYPMEYSKNNYNNLKKSYSEKTYQELILMAPQKIQNTGYKKVYQYLTYLIVRCLDKQQKKRPCIEWIIIIIQCCISLKQHLNYW